MADWDVKSEAQSNDWSVKSEQSSQPARQPQQGNQLARQIGLGSREIVQGALSPITALGDALNAPINAITGSKLQMPSEMLSQGLTKIGLPKPETGMEKAVGEVGELVSGAATMPGVKGQKVIDTGKKVVDKTVGGAVNEGKKLSSGWNARSSEQLDKIAKDMRLGASAKIRQANSMGAIVGKPSMQKLLRNINTEMGKTGLLNEKIHGDTMAVVKDLQKDIKKGDVSLEKVEQYRQLLRDVIRKNTSKIEGANPEVPKAMAAIDALDDSLDALAEKDFVTKNPSKGVDAIGLIKDYRKQWSRARRFERVSDIIEASGGDASKLRDMMGKFTARDHNLAGFSPAERQALKKLGNPGKVDKFMRGAGTLGLNPAKKNFNGFIPLVEGMTALHNPALLAPMVGGTAANLYRNMASKGQAEQILKMIEQEK